MRYYIGEHNNEIIDLYDGKYFIDDNSRRNVKASDNIAAADPTWQYEKLQVGDKVYRDYDGHVHQEGVFAQLEWTRNKLNAFVSGSVSNTGYWRYDRFYYDAAHAESEHVNFIGYTVKGGANYNITEKHNVFANLGYISRAPLLLGRRILQSSTTSNVTNPDPLNERVFSAELGYGFRSGIFTANLNAYYTLWMDKSFVRSTQMSNGDYARINLGGVDARHMGIELDFSLRPTRWMDITGMLSLGDWIWDSNTKGYIYDSQGQPMTAALDGTVASGIMADDHAWLYLKQKGIKVGGSAQTTGAIGVTVRPMKGLRVSADWNAYGQQLRRLLARLGPERQPDHRGQGSVAHSVGAPARPLGQLPLQDRQHLRHDLRQREQRLQLQLHHGCAERRSPGGYLAERLRRHVLVRTHLHRKSENQLLTILRNIRHEQAYQTRTDLRSRRTRRYRAARSMTTTKPIWTGSTPIRR